MRDGAKRRKGPFAQKTALRKPAKPRSNTPQKRPAARHKARGKPLTAQGTANQHRPLMRKSKRRKRQSTTAVPLTATIIMELPCPIVS